MTQASKEHLVWGRKWLSITYAFAHAVNMLWLVLSVCSGMADGFGVPEVNALPCSLRQCSKVWPVWPMCTSGCDAHGTWYTTPSLGGWWHKFHIVLVSKLQCLHWTFCLWNGYHLVGLLALYQFANDISLLKLVITVYNSQWNALFHHSYSTHKVLQIHVWRACKVYISIDTQRLTQRLQNGYSKHL